MKKFKSILCGAMAFVAGSVVLSACGAKTNPNENPTQQEEQQQQETAVGTKTTISLAEAKKLIVSALAIDNKLSTQSTNGIRVYAADASEGNRDVYEKLGKFSINQHSCYTNPKTNEKLSEYSSIGIATYHNGFQTFLMDEGDVKIYWVNGEFFELYGNVDYSTNTEFKESFGGYQELFEDEAFDIIYKGATKETLKDGYSITLNGDLKGFINYLHQDWNYYQELIKDYLEYLDKCYFNVTVNVDGNNDVISAVVDLVMLVSSNKNIELLKQLITFTGEPNLTITEPTWVTEYKNSEEYKNSHN